STDADAGHGDSIVKYEWDLNNDGTYDVTTNSATTTVSWATMSGFHASPGTYAIGLRVTDSFGATATATTTLSIYDNRPFAAFTISPSSAAPNQSVTFDASGSHEGSPFHSIVSYAWDFGDGSSSTGVNPTATHAYSLFGTYTVTLKVTDDNTPAKTDVTTHAVFVNQGNLPPVAIAGGPYVVQYGQGATLDASGSFDPNAAAGDQIVQYSWDLNNDGFFGDATGATVALSAAQVAAYGLGTFPIGVRVSDTFGATGTSS